MKKLILLAILFFLASPAYAIDVTKDINDTYNVILPDGSGNQVATTFKVKLITAKGSYVGDLYDADGKCIAQNRRFFFADSPAEQLNDGEKGLVTGDEPEETWEAAEIKVWLDSKQVKDSEGIVLKDDPYAYDEKDDKAALLKIISDKTELQEVSK